MLQATGALDIGRIQFAGIYQMGTQCSGFAVRGVSGIVHWLLHASGALYSTWPEPVLLRIILLKV